MSEEVEQGKGINEWLKDYWLALTVVVVAVLAVTAIIYFYRQAFPGPIDAQHDAFGTFGDYVGGLLNPILSFLTIVLLIWSLHIQLKELRDSKREFAKSAKAQEDMQQQVKKEHELAEIQRMLNEIFEGWPKDFDEFDDKEEKTLVNEHKFEFVVIEKKSSKWLCQSAECLMQTFEWAYEYLSKGGAPLYVGYVLEKALKLENECWRSLERYQEGESNFYKGRVKALWQVMNDSAYSWRVKYEEEIALHADVGRGLYGNMRTARLGGMLSNLAQRAKMRVNETRNF